MSLRSPDPAGAMPFAKVRSMLSVTAKSNAGLPIMGGFVRNCAACCSVKSTAFTLRRAAGTENVSNRTFIPAIVVVCCMSSTGERNDAFVGCVMVK